MQRQKITHLNKPTWSEDNACLIKQANVMPPINKNTSQCESEYLGICLVKPSENLGGAVFGFSEFVTALALLVVVYTVTDVRYRFRVAIASAPLFGITYFLIGFIGFDLLPIN
jgi:hypothetical protein